MPPPRSISHCSVSERASEHVCVYVCVSVSSLSLCVCLCHNSHMLFLYLCLCLCLSQHCCYLRSFLEQSNSLIAPLLIPLFALTQCPPAPFRASLQANGPLTTARCLLSSLAFLRIACSDASVQSNRCWVSERVNILGFIENRLFRHSNSCLVRI